MAERLHLQISPELKEALITECERSGRSITAVVLRGIQIMIATLRDQPDFMDVPRDGEAI